MKYYEIFMGTVFSLWSGLFASIMIISFSINKKDKIRSCEYV